MPKNDHERRVAIASTIIYRVVNVAKTNYNERDDTAYFSQDDVAMPPKDTLGPNFTEEVIMLTLVTLEALELDMFDHDKDQYFIDPTTAHKLKELDKSHEA